MSRPANGIAAVKERVWDVLAPPGLNDSAKKGPSASMASCWSCCFFQHQIHIFWNWMKFGYMVYPLLRSFAKRTPFPNMVGYWDGLLLAVPDCCCHGGTKLGNSQPRELNQLLSPDPISPGSDPTVVALSSCKHQLLAYPLVMTNIAIEHGT